MCRATPIRLILQPLEFELKRLAMLQAAEQAADEDLGLRLSTAKAAAKSVRAQNPMALSFEIIRNSKWLNEGTKKASGSPQMARLITPIKSPTCCRTPLVAFTVPRIQRGHWRD